VTLQARILSELTRDDGLDDDELAIRLGVHPRQAVNQAARALEHQGRIVRRKEPGYKIVNLLRRSPEA
jgi:biotin operon repressor